MVVGVELVEVMVVLVVIKEEVVVVMVEDVAEVMMSPKPMQPWRVFSTESGP